MRIRDRHSLNMCNSLPPQTCIGFPSRLLPSPSLPPSRQGIIFLILNYNHIRATLRAADSRALQPPLPVTIITTTLH